MAITSTSNIISINNATPTSIHLDSNVVDFETYVNDLGLEATGTDGYYYSPTTIQSGGQNISGNNVVEMTRYTDPATQENGIKIQPLRAIEDGDTTVNSGGLNVKMAPMSVFMPALYGAGIGWELQKAYPEFFSDLSDALFGSTTPITDLNYDTTTFFDVIIRATEEGGLRAYCDKRHITNILEKAYDLGAFSPLGSTERTYHVGDNQTLEAGGYDYGVTMGWYDSIVTQWGQGSFSREGIKQNLLNTIPTDANAFVNRKILSSGEYEYRTYAFKVNPLNLVTVTTTGTDDFFTLATQQGIEPRGWFSIKVGSDGRPSSVASHTPDMGWAQADCKLRGNDVIASSLGATYNPPRDDIKWNPEIPLPQSKPEIWTGALADWLAGSFELPSIDPATGAGAVTTMVPLPLINPAGSPVVEPDPVKLPSLRKGIVEQPEPEKVPDWLKPVFDPDPINPDIGKPSELPFGDTPIVTTPSYNNSTKLFTVYNPTRDELNQLGGYLWSADIGELIKELFTNNRMDAIISLHQIYCHPSVTSPQHIILGNLDSNVSAKVVDDQYATVDCGTKYVAEMYGDARDYLNVDCQIYLPFIGFRSVDPHDVINCYIHIVYTIDTYTGSCLAQIIVTKGSVTQTLYTFEGNCSIQIPLTGSDRARIIGALASTVASGIVAGPAGAVASGVAQVAYGGMQGRIQRTSGFSGNCGAMAIKKPYIVITRLKSSDALDFNKIVGYPTNKTVYLVNCKGFTRVKAIHLDNIHCTDREKEMLMAVLKQGIQI